MTKDLFTTPSAEPPLPPGYLEQTMALARKAHRLDRGVRLVMATLAVLLFGTFGSFIPAQLTSGPGLQRSGLVLPDRIEGYRPLTADVSRSPGGAALMLFESGSDNKIYSYQALALGGDGRTYRDVDALRGSDGRYTRRAMLSPDGTGLLIVEGDGATTALTYVDLLTGQRREYPLPEPAGVLLYSWSPDGQYVAFGHTPWVTGDPELTVYRKGVLSILDLKVGKITSLAHFGRVAAAAFAPGSVQMALQAGTQLIIADVDGTRPREIRLPDTGLGIVPGVAWSPDGRLIAMMPWSEEYGPAEKPGYPNASRKITFVDSTGGGSRTVPNPVFSGRMIGWRTPVSIADIDYASFAITEISLTTPDRRILTIFERENDTCEWWTQRCDVSDVTFASGLLLSADLQPAEEPLRGPWPRWLEVGVAVGAGLVGLLFFLVIRRIRRRGEITLS